MIPTILAMNLYMMRMMFVGIAIGIFFIRLRLFNKMSKSQIIVLGVTTTPLTVSLTDYLLGLVFIGWSNWFYYLIPFILSVVWLLSFNNYKIAFSVFVEIWEYIKGLIKRAGNWIFLDLILICGTVFLEVLLFNNSCSFWELCSNYILPLLQSMNVLGRVAGIVFVIVIILAIFYVAMRMYRKGRLRTNLILSVFLVMLGCGVFFGLSFIGRPDIDADRAHYQLEARYFCESKNSWEIDNYSDEKYGSSQRDDHGPLWILNLADAKIIADMTGMDDPLRMVNFAIFWVYFCFNVLLFLTSSFISKKYSAGLLSLLLFNLYRYEVLMILGSRDAFRFVGLLLLYLYLINILTDIMKDCVQRHHYAFMFLFCYLAMNGHQSNVYVMLGMFTVVAVILIVFRTRIKNLILCGVMVLGGTLLGISKTIMIYLDTGVISSSTSLAFHDTPVIKQLQEISNKRADWSTIWATYTKPVVFMIGLGLLALIVMMVVSAFNRDKRLFISASIIMGMLLPMTGIMDWMGYKCSIWFAEQLRYRMYFLMLFAITGGWFLTRLWVAKYIRYACHFIAAAVFGLWISAENDRLSIYNRQYIANCISSVESYKNLANDVASVTRGGVFTSNQVILYYLQDTPKLLYHIYTEDLIQAKTDGEIEAALGKLNIGAILLPENGLDYHDYSLLPFWKYINEDSSFSQIKHEESGYMIFYNK